MTFVLFGYSVFLKRPFFWLRLVELSPEALHGPLAGFRLQGIGHAVARSGDDHQPVGSGAGQIILVGHLNGDKGVRRSVDEEHGGAAGLHGGEGGVGPQPCVELPAEGPVQPQPADGGIGHVQVLLCHMTPDGLGRGEAAVGGDALDVFGQGFTGGHEHRGGAHGDAAEVDGQLRPLPGRPGGPGLAVLPLQEAEAHVFSFTFSLAPLLYVEHMAAGLPPEGSHHAEVPVPAGPPAARVSPFLRSCCRFSRRIFLPV